MNSEQGPIVVHVQDFGFDGVGRVGLFQQPFLVSLGEVFQMEGAICLKKVKDGKKDGYKSPSHPLPLWGKVSLLVLGVPQKYILRDPFAH